MTRFQKINSKLKAAKYIVDTIEQEVIEDKTYLRKNRKYQKAIKDINKYTSQLIELCITDYINLNVKKGDVYTSSINRGYISAQFTKVEVLNVRRTGVDVLYHDSIKSTISYQKMLYITVLDKFKMHEKIESRSFCDEQVDILIEELILIKTRDESIKYLLDE